jgi:hypothetical protein
LELTTTEEGDASLVGPLLDQIDSPIELWRKLGDDEARKVA